MEEFSENNNSVEKMIAAKAEEVQILLEKEGFQPTNLEIESIRNLSDTGFLKKQGLVMLAHEEPLSSQQIKLCQTTIDICKDTLTDIQTLQDSNNILAIIINPRIN